jgi:hypothetical protein
MRYIIGLLLGIGLIVLTFILIFRAFSGGDEPRQERIDLMSYATTDAVMRLTIDGPIDADQEHDRVRITVSNDQVLYEEIQGYEGRLIESRTYPSNTQAYGNFLRALALAGYTNGNPEADDDERGYCPRGSRYVYEALDGGDTILRWWSTSCTSSEGNFLGNASTVRNLFIRQVVDYNQLTRGLDT